MTMYLRRRASFSAGYRQPPPDESGGGHNFLCELTVGGDIDPHTGMVVNIKDVDAVLKSQVLVVLDGQLLDDPLLGGASPTLENLTCFIWQHCGPALPASSRLARTTLWATPTRWAELTALPLLYQMPGGEPMSSHPTLTVTRAYDFSASHRLHSAELSDAENDDLFGKCNWPHGHGHNYQVEVTLTGMPDARTGQITSLAALDAVVEEEVLKPYDHRHLNLDAPEFAALNPTSENLTRVIWDKLSARLTAGALGSARLYRVVVRETERNYFEYYGA